MGFMLFLLPLLVLALIYWLTLKNNKNVELNRMKKISDAIINNDILNFQKLFLKEIKKSTKEFKNETNLSYLRRLRESGNLSNRNDYPIIASYFHFLVGYIFDEYEELFTKNDRLLLEDKPTKNIKLSSAQKKSDYNILYQFLKGQNEVNIYKVYTKEEKEEAKKIIKESEEFFKNENYSFYDKFIYVILKEGMNIDSLDKSGRTPLFISCYLGKEDLVYKLLSKKANLNKKNRKFMNLCPLTSLVLKRRFKIIKKLLEDKKIDLEFFLNELNILEKQYVIDEDSFKRAMALVKPYLVKKQTINFLNEREKIKYLKHFSDEEICHFLKKYIFEDVLES